MGRVKSDPSINLLFPLEVARRLEDPWCRLQIIYLGITFCIYPSGAPFSNSFGFHSAHRVTAVVLSIPMTSSMQLKRNATFVHNARNKQTNKQEMPHDETY